MSDDKDHEYVPQTAPGVLDARLELREVKADLRQAQHDHTELLIERNNMAEALREVNARLVEVTKERDGYHNRWQMLERDIEPLREQANRVPILEENVTRLAAQLAAAKVTITSLTVERDAARQSRKRLVSLVSRYNELIEIYNHEFDFVLDERESWKSRAKEAEAERNAALLKRLGDDRQSAREMEDDEQ